MPFALTRSLPRSIACLHVARSRSPGGSTVVRLRIARVSRRFAHCLIRDLGGELGVRPKIGSRAKNVLVGRYSFVAKPLAVDSYIARPLALLAMKLRTFFISSFAVFAIMLGTRSAAAESPNQAFAGRIMMSSK